VSGNERGKGVKLRFGGRGQKKKPDLADKKKKKEKAVIEGENREGQERTLKCGEKGCCRPGWRKKKPMGSPEKKEEAGERKRKKIAWGNDRRGPQIEEPLNHGPAKGVG